MTEPHSTAPDAPARGAAIDLHNFGWHHPGREKPAFSNVNLRIEPGQKVLLLGSSGAGKSTLLHAIAGVLHDHDGQSQSGSARIDGVAPEDARGLIGLMQQDPESSVVLARVGDDVAFGPENLAVAREEIWARVDDALAAVGLDYLPHEHPTNALSGGQKQRLGLAGILAMHPRAILLDEPTANLDPEGVQQVRDAVVQAVTATGATLIVVEHRVGVWAQHMDRVIVLGADGGITHDGAPETVLAQARETLIANGVWVPGYVPEPAAAAAPSGRILLSAENLAITREFPSKKQLRARRRQLKTMPEPAPVPLDIPALRRGINLSIREGEHLTDSLHWSKWCRKINPRTHSRRASLRPQRNPACARSTARVRPKPNGRKLPHPRENSRQLGYSLLDPRPAAGAHRLRFPRTRIPIRARQRARRTRTRAAPSRRPAPRKN